MPEATWGNQADSTSTDALIAPWTQLWQSREGPEMELDPSRCGFSTDGLETLIKSLNVAQALSSRGTTWVSTGVSLRWGK